MPPRARQSDRGWAKECVVDQIGDMFWWTLLEKKEPEDGAVLDVGVPKVEVVSPGGSVSFQYKVSSERGFDVLRFLVDDVEQTSNGFPRSGTQERSGSPVGYCWGLYCLFIHKGFQESVVQSGQVNLPSSWLSNLSSGQDYLASGQDYLPSGEEYLPSGEEKLSLWDFFFCHYGSFVCPPGLKIAILGVLAAIMAVLHALGALNLPSGQLNLPSKIPCELRRQ